MERRRQICRILGQEFLRSSINWMCLLEVVDKISEGETPQSHGALVTRFLVCGESRPLSIEGTGKYFGKEHGTFRK